MKNKKKNFFEENINLIVVGVICFIVGAICTIPFWPKRIAKLENGEEVIVEVKGHNFTADDLYKSLKERLGNEVLFKMVDLALLKDKYPNDEEAAKEFATEQKDTVISSYQQYYGYTKEQFLEMNGFASESEFEEELFGQYYYQKYYDEYVGNTITEKELSKFYKESVFGEKSIYLFSAISEEKDDLEAIQKKLKNKVDFNEIKEKYKNVNCYSYEAVKFSDTDTFTQNVLNHVASTKSGSSSEIFEDDTYGNVLVYVVSDTDKPKEDEVMNDMHSSLVKNKQSEDDKLYYQAFIHLREDNDLNILDTELKKFYNDSIKQYK